MKSYRSQLFISIIAVLVLALALAACGGSEEPTPAPEPPPAEPTTPQKPTAEPKPTEVPTKEPKPTEESEPTEEPAPAVDFKEFDSDEAGLKIEYPAGWVFNTTFPEFLVFASSQEALESSEPGETDGVVLLMHGATADFPTDDPAATLEEFITEFDFGGKGIRGEIKATTINGNPAATAIVDGESDNGTLVTTYVAIVIDGDWAAVFTGGAPADVEDDYLYIFEAMANSIELREPAMVEKPDGPTGGGILPASEGFLLYGDSIDGHLEENSQGVWDFIGLGGEVIDLVVSPATDDLDLIVNIVDENGQSFLESPLDESFGTESLNGFEIPTSATYFITIESLDGSAGDYSLTLTESNGTATTGNSGNSGSGNSNTGSEEAIIVESGAALTLSQIYASSVDGTTDTTLTFTGVAGEFADISVSPLTEELDVTIDVLDPSGLSLLEAPLDASYNAEYIRILQLPEDGVYTVVVTSYNNVSGEFEILVEESYLSNPATFVFAHDLLGDEDAAHSFPFYTFADELVVVQVNPEAGHDVVIELWDDDTDELLREEDGTTGFEEIVFFAPKDGNYSFRVVGYNGSTGEYDINLIGSEYVYFELAIGDFVFGRFGDKNLFEYYIGGEAGDTFTISADTDDELDLILQLVDFDENVIASADNNLVGESETLTYTFTEDALLILQVSDLNASNAGKFTFFVE